VDNPNIYNVEGDKMLLALNIFDWSRYYKIVIAFIWGEHQVDNIREVDFPLSKALRENNYPRVDNFWCWPHMKSIIVYIEQPH
jgi:hypothetical protein